MGIGPHVRRLFGRHERWISEIYRRAFVNLDALVDGIARRIPPPEHILEIGCGEGMLCERLAAAFPHSQLTGVDVCAEPGRLYAAPPARVRFIRTTAHDLARTDPTRYQLVIIADVLHHVAPPHWTQFLASSLLLLSDQGIVALKDWTRAPTPAYWMAYLADRFITGDHIKYPHERELRALAHHVFGSDSIRCEFRVPPWRCNTALLIAPTATPAPQPCA